MMGYQTSKKFQDRFSRLDTIPACDIQPAIQPHCRSNSRAMHYLHRAVKKIGLDSNVMIFDL